MSVRKNIIKNSWFCASLRRFGTGAFRALAFAAAAAPIVFISSAACAQSVALDTQATEVHAGMPFQLSVIAADFDESPQPEIQEFSIDGADVQLSGVSPQISSSMTIINGRVTSNRNVKFVYTYTVTPKKEGQYIIPIVTAVQGTKSASTKQRVSFTASAVQSTQDMKFELHVPTDKIWVGQSFEVTLDWYLRRDVSGQVFSVPMFEMPDTFEVEEPEENGHMRGVNINIGTRQIAFPVSRDNVTLRGLEYTRFRIPVTVTALKAGVIELPAARVMAQLEEGSSRDVWGFRANYKYYQAEDVAHTLTVKELPLAGRPESYSNAMGSDFDIQVSADRTIVKAGDPIILTIDISSAKNALDGIILPRLNSAGLNDQFFGIAPDDPIGESIEGAKGRNIRRFTVPVRIRSERVTEIPPIAFSFFDPKTEKYGTVRSQPIALSVSAVDKVSVGDVVAAQKMPAKDSTNPSDKSANSAVPADPTAGTLDLGLQTKSADLTSKPLSSYNTRPLRLGLYGAPFAVWFGLLGLRRLRKSRLANEEQRKAASALRDALDSAQSMGAREASSAIANALNAFIVATDSPRDPFRSLIQRMEDEAYRPNADHLPADLIEDMRKSAKLHVNPAFAKIAASLLILLIACCFFTIQPSQGYAQDSAAQDSVVQNAPDAQNAAPLDNDLRLISTGSAGIPLLDAAAAQYHKALSAADRSERILAFKRASAMYADLSKQYPWVNALKVDAGNAALGAMDFGRAALYYRRALDSDPAIEQAKNNLAYIQNVQGEKVDSSGVKFISSALYLNMSIQKRLLIAAILFFIAVMLIIPWSRKNRKIFCFIAIIPFSGWAWFLAGAYLAPTAKADAVVMHECYLKTADNAGASNTSPDPLEPGFTVIVTETRDAWAHVQTLSGDKGWISQSAIEFVKENNGE